MLVVVSIGGGALRKCSEPTTVESPHDGVKRAAHVLAPVMRKHRLVVSHGHGMQTGMLTLEAPVYPQAEPFPPGLISAQTEGMLGTLIKREFRSWPALQAPPVPMATVLTMVEVDPNDPDFVDPTKPIGPVYEEAQAKRLAAEKGHIFKSYGDGWRRAVSSPTPKRIFALQAIKRMLRQHAAVICTGIGISMAATANTANVDEGDSDAPPRSVADLQDVEAVLDTDRVSALMAKELGADFLVLATDVEGVYLNWGRPDAELLEITTSTELKGLHLDDSTIGPKVEAACDFAEASGAFAAIGKLDDVEKMLAGEAGTIIGPDSKLRWLDWPERGTKTENWNRSLQKSGLVVGQTE